MPSEVLKETLLADISILKVEIDDKEYIVRELHLLSTILEASDRSIVQ